MIFGYPLWLISRCWVVFSILLYNLKGQVVRSFVNSHDQPGYYQVSWDGRDSGGRVVSTGVYFYRMVSGRYRSTKKMVLAK